MAGSDGRHHRAVLKRGGAGFATPVTRTRREGIVVAVLALSAAAQAAVIGKRMLDDHARHDEIEVGDDLSEASLRRADGSPAGLGGGRTTVLLVYDPDCAHSDRVAGGWRKWLERGDHGGANRVFALHAGSRSRAEAYAVAQGWPIEVVSVGSGVDRSEVHALARRTPWVFALDEDGVVVASGHGRELPQVAQAVIPARSGRTLAGDPLGLGPHPPGGLARRTESDQTAGESVP